MMAAKAKANAEKPSTEEREHAGDDFEAEPADAEEGEEETKQFDDDQMVEP